MLTHILIHLKSLFAHDNFESSLGLFLLTVFSPIYGSYFLFLIDCCNLSIIEQWKLTEMTICSQEVLAVLWIKNLGLESGLFNAIISWAKLGLNLSLKFISVQFSSVAQSCPTLCDPMNRSTPGLPVHHQPPEFTQTHVHRVSDAIQPSHPLLSPSPPAPNPSQHNSLLFSAIIVLTSEWSCSQNISFQNIMLLFQDCNVFYFSKDITDGFNFICVLFVPSWFHQVTFLYFFTLVSIFPLEIFLIFLIPFKCLAIFNTRSLRMWYVSLGLIDPVTLR